MKINFLTLTNQENLIEGVVLHKLVVHRDPRGTLVETLRQDWVDVFGQENPFRQSYYSETEPQVARDEDKWHVHPTKQVDRFLILRGNAVVALYDARKESQTYKTLNLFLMGEVNGDENQYLLFIPKRVLHGFCAIGTTRCGLLNFPSHLYDPAEEGRIPFAEVNAKLPDGTPFSWDIVREYINRGTKPV